jgi:hypothetical protein
VIVLEIQVAYENSRTEKDKGRDERGGERERKNERNNDLPPKLEKP